MRKKIDGIRAHIRHASPGRMIRLCAGAGINGFGAVLIARHVLHLQGFSV